MKRFLTGLGMVMMICLVCISCKKEETNYPTEINGLWAGGNGSTGYSCNVLFTPNAKNTCTISITSPDKSTTDTFEGTYTYDQSSGIGLFTSVTLHGEITAKFRYSEDSTQLIIIVKSLTVDYEKDTYTLHQATLPNSISGSWSGKATKDERSYDVNATFSPFAVSGGLPVTITIKEIPKIDLIAKYTYEQKEGIATITIPDLPDAKMTYNSINHKLSGTVSGYEIEIERMPAQ